MRRILSRLVLTVALVFPVGYVVASAAPAHADGYWDCTQYDQGYECIWYDPAPPSGYWDCTQYDQGQECVWYSY